MMELVGGWLFVLGLGGMGSACEGQGSFMISAIVFSIGFGLCLANYMRKGA